MSNYIIYGAGNNCKELLRLNPELRDSVICIVDQDEGLSGKYIYNIEVYPVGHIKYEKCCDEIIISIHEFDSAIDTLLEEGISCKKISIYEIDNNLIIQNNCIIEAQIYRTIWLKCIVEKLKASMLVKYFKYARRQGYHRIYCLCDDKDVELIKDMHSKLMPDCVLSLIESIDEMNLMQLNGQIMIANVNRYQSQIRYLTENNIPLYFCDLVPLSSINASIKKKNTWRNLTCEF